ncbi:unnamed protein product [Protopolystoma xenopodis]|uniref:Uncharacterized protein n=1 Tax=Protopolystoma xenopodis TaxID=117903 RepID=A0A3S5C731_9PLAT|nr:unnamed protein product [Protopolystoma xenopodis]
MISSIWPLRWYIPENFSGIVSERRHPHFLGGENTIVHHLQNAGFTVTPVPRSGFPGDIVTSSDDAANSNEIETDYNEHHSQLDDNFSSSPLISSADHGFLTQLAASEPSSILRQVSQRVLQRTK